MGVQRHKVPHFKGLISANLNPRAQGHDSNFTFCHALLKKAILHLKMATVRFHLNTAVRTVNLNKTNYKPETNLHIFFVILAFCSL